MNTWKTIRLFVSYAAPFALSLALFAPVGIKYSAQVQQINFEYSLVYAADFGGGDVGGSSGGGDVGGSSGGGDIGGSAGGSDLGGSHGGTDVGGSHGGFDVGGSHGGTDVGGSHGGDYGGPDGGGPDGGCVVNCTPPLCVVNCTPPCTVNCEPPCTVNCNPCTVNCNPCTVNCNPCTVNCNPCTVNCNPCTVNCNPCTVNCNPPCTVNCGGGEFPPSVVLFSKPSEQPLAFVTLSQIPYTGYEAGPLGHFLFWALLVLWSVVASYFIAVKRLPGKLYALLADLALGTRVNEGGHEATIVEEKIVAPAPAPISAVAPTAPRVVSAPAKASGIARPVSLSPEHTEYVTTAPSFVRAIAEGKIDQAFEQLRGLKVSQKSAQDFMESAVCELDEAYRCRLDKSAPHNEAMLSAIGALTNTQVERVIEALASAVDRSYGSDYTGAKVALLRAVRAAGRDLAPAPAPTVSAAPASVAPASAPKAPQLSPITVSVKHKPLKDYTDDFVLAQIERLRKV